MTEGGAMDVPAGAHVVDGESKRGERASVERVYPNFLGNLVPSCNRDACHDQLELAVAPDSSNFGLVNMPCAVVRLAGLYVIQKSGMHPCRNESQCSGGHWLLGQVRS
jgi:hypothetical protein